MSKLNRRGPPLSLLLPPNDAGSPIAGNKMDSTLMIKYLRGGESPMSPVLASGKGFRRSGSSSSVSSSPLSVVDKVKYGGTPVKVVDDDVLVMDGILVSSGGGGGSSRSSSASSSSSGGLGGSGPRKNELCKAWEDLGHCRYGSKCQFAHGKEDIHPTFLPVKKKTEVPSRKSYTIGSPLCAPKYRIPLLVMTEAADAAFLTASSMFSRRSSDSPTICVKPEYLNKNTSSATKHDSSGRNSSSNMSDQSKRSHLADVKSEDFGKLDPTTTQSDYWSPLDDGIEVTLPTQVGIFLDRGVVHAHINTVLYGPTTKKRLPVFTELC